MTSALLPAPQPQPLGNIRAEPEEPGKVVLGAAGPGTHSAEVTKCLDRETKLIMKKRGLEMK